MNATELIKDIMKEKGWTCAAIAKKLGYPTASFISEKLRRENGMRTDWFIKILNAMDYEIIVKDTIGTKKQRVLTNDKEQ